jgi:hypothetical protein
VFKFVRKSGATLLCWGCCCALLAGATGCPDNDTSSGGGSTVNASNSGSSEPKKSSAAKAWEDLHNQEELGHWGALVTNGAAHGVMTGLEQEEQRANMECQRAMQTPLPSAAINAMIDEMAQDLTRKLPNEPEVKNSPNQLVLAFGNMVDASQSNNPTVSAALDSIRSKLFESELMKANFVFVTSNENDAAKLNEQIAGKDLSAFRDPLQKAPDPTKPVVYDPSSIFLINGKLTAMPDQVNHTEEITLQMTFTHVQSRRLVENLQFTRTYMWHPKKHVWEQQS